VHDPHWRRFPHPSAIAPQDTPCAPQVVGAHVGVMHWLFEQSCVGLHVLPQSRMLPHPSEVCPHIRFRVGQVFGEHFDGLAREYAVGYGLSERRRTL